MVHCNPAVTDGQLSRNSLFRTEAHLSHHKPSLLDSITINWIKLISSIFLRFIFIFLSTLMFSNSVLWSWYQNILFSCTSSVVQLLHPVTLIVIIKDYTETLFVFLRNTLGERLLSFCLSVALQPFVGLWPLFSFLIFYIICRTPWTGDQSIAMLLPAYRGQHKQNKRTLTSMPLAGFEPTIPVFERAETVHASDRAATVIGFCCHSLHHILPFCFPFKNVNTDEDEGLYLLRYKAV
jgi:hypothetical protein